MYNKEGLVKGIQQCKVNKKALLDAANKEDATISEYRRMIKALDEDEKIKSEMEVHVEVEK